MNYEEEVEHLREKVKELTSYISMVRPTTKKFTEEEALAMFNDVNQVWSVKFKNEFDKNKLKEDFYEVLRKNSLL